MCDDLDSVRVKMVIRDGFGGCVEDGRDVVFGLYVGWDCG